MPQKPKTHIVDEARSAVERSTWSLCGVWIYQPEKQVDTANPTCRKCLVWRDSPPKNPGWKRGRPRTVYCERCDRDVPVGSRGPAPRRCPECGGAIAHRPDAPL